MAEKLTSISFIGDVANAFSLLLSALLAHSSFQRKVINKTRKKTLKKLRPHLHFILNETKTPVLLHVN